MSCFLPLPTRHYAFILSAVFLPVIPAFPETVQYDLTIERGEVNFTGAKRHAMTINGGIPGPVLEFTEGDDAVLKVHNRMDVDTSIHWHGLLVPPDMDGVPYVTYPPIKPDSTFTYRFPIRHAGTYWYHSHSGLQEQIGVYGQIVIHPRKERTDIGRVDLDVPVLLSDWSDETPHEITKSLRRGSEFYSIRKNSALNLVEAAKFGMLKDYFQRELVRMPPMDISDVYYDRFLANGCPEQTVAAAPGQVVRLRLVDGSASTFFYGEFAGGKLFVIEADGQPVEPMPLEKILIGTAETYDVLVKVPSGKGKLWEFRATAHDSSGHASIWIGDPGGQRQCAPDVPMANLYHAMGKPKLNEVLALTPPGTMSMSDRVVKVGELDQPGINMEGMEEMSHQTMAEMMKNMEMPGMMMSMEGISHGGMQMDPGAQTNHSAHGNMATEATTAPTQPRVHSGDHEMVGSSTNHSTHGAMATPDSSHPTSGMKHGSGSHGGMSMSSMKNIDLWQMGMDEMEMSMDMDPGPIQYKENGRKVVVDKMHPDRPMSPYGMLRAVRDTSFPAEKPVREVRLTLDGNMERYVWLLNGKALHEDDSIHIKEGEVVRFIMINRTMMYHPMHLHGHFFRVINGHGDRSPLKHTVAVSPMETTVIEFYANEVGDWFFHCHLLYHMHNGMARVVEYENFTPPAETQAVRHKLYDVDLYQYGMADVMSHMTEGFYEIAGLRYSALAEWEVGWGNVEETEYDIKITGNYFHNRFLSLFGGVDLTNSEDYPDARGIFGYRYPLPFLIDTYGWVDTEGEFRFGATKSYPILDRLHIFAKVEYDTRLEWEWDAGLEYVIGKNLSAIGNYHSEFGLGAGATVRF